MIDPTTGQSSLQNAFLQQWLQQPTGNGLGGGIAQMLKMYLGQQMDPNNPGTWANNKQQQSIVQSDIANDPTGYGS